VVVVAAVVAGAASRTGPASAACGGARYDRVTQRGTARRGRL